MQPAHAAHHVCAHVEDAVPTDYPLAIDAAYRWPIEADTHQLSEDTWIRDYFYRTMREICWDLGVENDPGATLTVVMSQDGVDAYAVGMKDPEGNEFDAN